MALQTIRSTADSTAPEEKDGLAVPGSLGSGDELLPVFNSWNSRQFPG